LTMDDGRKTKVAATHVVAVNRLQEFGDPCMALATSGLAIEEAEKVARSATSVNDGFLTGALSCRCLGFPNRQGSR